MLIYPAIDLYAGEAVRLYKGDYAQKTVYSSEPVNIALDFAAKGARQMHIVDLEGAKTGETPNLELILRIKREGGLLCEVGGGIRTQQTAAKYLDGGIDRVILGTAAVQKPELVRELVQSYGDRIAVGIDIKDGNVAVNGWLEDSGVDAFSFCDRMCALGVGTIICTDISRDGAMRGTNRELYKELSKRFPVNIIASGGVSAMEDVEALAALGIHGAIIGKAYYTGAIDLKKAIEVAAC